jgi:3-methyladenine DNA glycosylase AlkD
MKTGIIRKISSKMFRTLSDKNIDNILPLCESLLEEHNWEMKVIAFDWANRVCKQYTKDTYFIFYTWLKNYVRNWGDCDDFCTHAFGNLLMQYKEIFINVLEWTKDEDFVVRRASAVILIPSLLRNDCEGLEPFEIANRLMNDKNELVLKGYGWMLKAFSQVNKEEVIDYLIKNHKNMPRVSFRYAIEKMDEGNRLYLMKL